MRRATGIIGVQQGLGNQGVLGLGARLQRSCSACASGKGLCPKCAQEKSGAGLQRRATGSAPSVAPPVVHEVLRGAGAPLDGATRNYFESRMGQDLSGVRVHTGARAAESAAAVGARAYTVASHVVFGAGEYAPGSGAGRHVLAHELAHVAQQRGASIGGTIPIGGAHDSAERAADQVADAALSGAASPGPVSCGARLRRLGANPGCTAPQQTVVRQAIYNARGWLNKAVPKMEAAPLSTAAQSSLRRNFGPTYGVAANAPLIVGRLRAVYGEISSIPFRCAGAAEPLCAALHCGFAVPGGHSATICSNVTLTAGTDWRFQAGCVLHESFHSAFSGFTAARDSYSGWHGVAGATPGYPGAGVDPLLNADTYTTLVMDLS